MKTVYVVLFIYLKHSNDKIVEASKYVYMYNHKSVQIVSFTYELEGFYSTQI